MKSNAEPLEGSKVKLIVELDQKEVDEAVTEAFKRIAGQVNIPGFRKGKAPRQLIEARVGAEAARAQALNDSLPEYYIKALHEQDIDAIAAPQIKITSGEDEGPVAFEAEVPVRPVAAVPGYQGLKVTVPNPEPSDEDIDKQIERLQTQFAELEPVEREAKQGDFVTIDIEGTHEGDPVPGLTATDYSHEVGSALQSLGPDFDTQIEGSKAGDQKEFTTAVPPNDEEVEFKITVKQVNERKLPDLTDEWANEVSEFDTIAELREDLANRFREVRKYEASRSLRTAVIEAVAQLVDEEIPEQLVDNEMQRQLRDIAMRLEQQGANLAQFLQATGQTEESFVEQLRANATEAVRADLALRSIAQKEGLEATDEEVDTEVEALAQQFGQKVSRVRRDLERADQIPAVRSDIRKAKAVGWLMENVEVVDDEGRTIDRKLLQIDSDHSGHDHAHEDEGES